MISSISFLTPLGQILLHRPFLDHTPLSSLHVYCSTVVSTRQYRQHPILLLNNISYINVPCNDILLLATTKSNINAALAVQFLYQLIVICKSYFNGEVNESLVRKNVSLLYEILDEVMDCGCPQIMDPGLLKKFIQEEGIPEELIKDKNKLSQMTGQITGAASWRPEGIIYNTNEVFVDVIEDVHCLVSAKGSLLKTEVTGTIRLKCLLSGMPECKLGMNDKLFMDREPNKIGVNTLDKGIIIEDMKFHQCVKLPKFDRQRSISFIPPDGTFDLMEYRINQNVNIPFKLIPVMTQSPSKIEIRLKVKSLFDKSILANNITIKIPCPKNTANVTTNTLLGRAKYEPQNGGIIWRIKKFAGEFEGVLHAEIQLGVTSQEFRWLKAPISMQFAIPMFTASGLRIRFFKVLEKEGYKPNKLMRSITKAGMYEYRI